MELKEIINYGNKKYIYYFLFLSAFACLWDLWFFLSVIHLYKHFIKNNEQQQEADLFILKPFKEQYDSL